jgi:hypothetical protein
MARLRPGLGQVYPLFTPYLLLTFPEAVQEQSTTFSDHKIKQKTHRDKKKNQCIMSISWALP